MGWHHIISKSGSYIIIIVTWPSSAATKSTLLLKFFMQLSRAFSWTLFFWFAFIGCRDVRCNKLLLKNQWGVNSKMMAWLNQIYEAKKVVTQQPHNLPKKMTFRKCSKSHDFLSFFSSQKNDLKLELEHHFLRFISSSYI